MRSNLLPCQAALLLAACASPQVVHYSTGSASTPAPAAPPAEAASRPPSSPDLSASAQALQQACDGGQQYACAGLGVLYWSGSGVAKDRPRAQALLQKACDAGEPMGCTLRDRLQHAESGTASSEVRTTVDPASVHAVETACQEGNSSACVGLAMLYWRGSGVPEDHAKALELLDHACTSGNSTACTTKPLLQQVPSAAP